jgi:CBS domain-containing protein
MRIEDVMTKQPICCKPTDTVQSVAAMMRHGDVGAIPVVSDLVAKRLEGIITDRDVCVSAIAEGKDPRTTTIAGHYTKDVITCSPDDTLAVCEQKMKEHRIRRIPVIDKNNSCIGMIVLADIVRVDKPEAVQALIAEISKPNVVRPQAPIAAA